MVMSEEEKRMTAYHEAGHAIVGMTVPEHDPVYKVTIIRAAVRWCHPVPAGAGSLQPLEAPPRERNCHTVWWPYRRGVDLRARGRHDRRFKRHRACYGAGTQHGYEVGLSDKLGPLTYSEENGEVFLGRSVTQHKLVSDGTAHAIDEEVRSVIESNFQRAKQILVERSTSCMRWRMRSSSTKPSTRSS